MINEEQAAIAVLLTFALNRIAALFRLVRDVREELAEARRVQRAIEDDPENW